MIVAAPGSEPAVLLASAGPTTQANTRVFPSSTIALPSQRSSTPTAQRIRLVSLGRRPSTRRPEALTHSSRLLKRGVSGGRDTGKGSEPIEGSGTGRDRTDISWFKSE